MDDRSLLEGIDDRTTMLVWEMYDEGLCLDDIGAATKIPLVVVHRILIEVEADPIEEIETVREGKGMHEGDVHTKMVGKGIRLAREHPSPSGDNKELDAKPLEEMAREIKARAASGKLSKGDQALYEAIGKLGVAAGFDDPDSVIYKRHLRFAHVLEHQIHDAQGRSKYHPMMDRQRKEDRRATGKWRKVVRKDMRRSGLIGPY